MKTRNAPRRPTQLRGFTTVELLIALVIVGVLVSIALPSFQNSIRKGRRSEAFAALAQLQQSQERWRSGHPAYSTSLSELGVTSPTPTGYYTLTVAESGAVGDTLATAYAASAFGVAGTSQAKDAECRNVSVRMRGGVLEYAGCGSCSTFSYAPTNACWSR